MSTDNSNLVASALRQTDPQLSLLVDAENTWATTIKERGERIMLFRRYERGDHRANITTQMKKMLRLGSDNASGTMDEFCDNYCQLIIEKMASRLKIADISSVDNNEKTEEWLGFIESYVRTNAIFASAFRAAVRDGDSYILVDPVTLRWVSEPAFDGTSGMVAVKDVMSNEVIWACKVWVQGSLDSVDSTAILMVYQKDKVSYWKGQAGSNVVEPYNIVPTEPSTEGIEGTVVNTKTWPGGKIPIVTITNKVDNYSQFGESELRPVIPLQDVLNRLLHSMVMASEFSAFVVRWAKGMRLPVDGIQPGAVLNLVLKDSDGNIISELDEAQVEFLKAVQVGQFAGTDISQYTKQIETIVKEISQTSGTPIYGITVQGNLSGDALRQLEIGLVGKVQRFQYQNEVSIEQLIQLTAEIQKAFATDQNRSKIPPAPSDLDSIQISWESAEIMDTTAGITALVEMRKESPGLWSEDFYRRKIGAYLGLSSAEITASEGEGMPEPLPPNTELEDSDGRRDE